MNISLLFFFPIIAFFHLIPAAAYDGYITHPISGDTILAGKPYTVTWFVDPTLTMSLNLIVLGGGFNVEIGTNIPNTGSFNWTVETWWPSTTSVYMVLNTAGWNTNTNQSIFKVESVGDQTGAAGLYHSTNLFRTDFCRSDSTVTVTQGTGSTVTVTMTECTESPTHVQTTQVYYFSQGHF